MGLFLSVILGVLPMFLYACFIYWLDRYEKEPRRVLGGVFIWGATAAAGLAFLVNTIIGLGIFVFTGSEGATDFTTGSLVAPVIEETLKGMAVLFVFLTMRKEFDSILDGIIYAAITALGFAATENVFYIYDKGYLANGMTGLATLAFVRIILVGWQHPFFSSFIGIGLALARTNRNTWIKVLAPSAGWLAAVITHSFHNAMSSILGGFAGLTLGTLIDWSGWLVLFGFTAFMIERERMMMETQLRSEVSLGTITPMQYQTACSALRQGRARLNASRKGQRSVTNRFYQLCGELAHRKRLLAIMGDEGENNRLILDLRSEMKSLSTSAGVDNRLFAATR